MTVHICQPCGKRFDVKKLWDEHLNEHHMNASDFPDA